MIYLDEPARLKEKGETVELEFRESMVHRLEKGYLLPGQTELLYPAAEILARMQKPYAVMLTGLDQKLPGMKVNQKFSIDVKNVNSYQNSFEILIKDLTRWKKEGYRVILLSASRTRASRLASDLREYDLRGLLPGWAGRRKRKCRRRGLRQRGYRKSGRCKYLCPQGPARRDTGHLRQSPQGI